MRLIFQICFINHIKINIYPFQATICWLEQSCEEELVLNPKSSFLFRPIHIPDGSRPLDGCCVSFSQFQGMERIHLIHLVDLLGKYEMFLRLFQGTYGVPHSNCY